jgi:hypothetical protein
VAKRFADHGVKFFCEINERVLVAPLGAPCL